MESQSLDQALAIAKQGGDDKKKYITDLLNGLPKDWKSEVDMIKEIQSIDTTSKQIETISNIAVIAFCTLDLLSAGTQGWAKEGETVASLTGLVSCAYAGFAKDQYSDTNKALKNLVTVVKKDYEYDLTKQDEMQGTVYNSWAVLVMIGVYGIFDSIVAILMVAVVFCIQQSQKKKKNQDFQIKKFTSDTISKLVNLSTQKNSFQMNLLDDSKSGIIDDENN